MNEKPWLLMVGTETVRQGEGMERKQREGREEGKSRQKEEDTRTHWGRR